MGSTMGSPLALNLEEIRDIILESLDGDKAALKACSLVNKSWREKSQRLLFRDFTLTLRIRDSRSVSCKLQGDFEHHWEIFAWTQEVNVRGLLPNPYDVELEHECLYDILKHTPRLRVLTVSGVTLTTAPAWASKHAAHFFEALPRLTELRVLCFRNIICAGALCVPRRHGPQTPESESGALAQQLLLQEDSFARLEELRIDGCMFYRRHIAELINAITLTHSRILKMDNKPSWFRGIRRATLPLEARVHCERYSLHSEIELYGRFINIAAPTLEGMTLNFMSFFWHYPRTFHHAENFTGLLKLLEGMNLSSCQKLVSLALVVPTHRGSSRDDQWLSASACLSLLARARSSSLKHISVLIHGMASKHRYVSDEVLLRYLDDAACTLKSLESFTIAPYLKLSNPEPREYFAPAKEHLPRLQEKNIELRLETHPTMFQEWV